MYFTLKCRTAAKLANYQANAIANIAHYFQRQFLSADWLSKQPSLPTTPPFNVLEPVNAVVHQALNSPYPGSVWPKPLQRAANSYASTCKALSSRTFGQSRVYRLYGYRIESLDVLVLSLSYHKIFPIGRLLQGLMTRSKFTLFSTKIKHCHPFHIGADFSHIQVPNNPLT